MFGNLLELLGNATHIFETLLTVKLENSTMSGECDAIAKKSTSGIFNQDEVRRKGTTIAYLYGALTDVDIGRVARMGDDDTFGDLNLTKKWFKENAFKLSDDDGKTIFLWLATFCSATYIQPHPVLAKVQVPENRNLRIHHH